MGESTPAGSLNDSIVLIVEDNPAISGLVKTSLGFGGYACAQTFSTDEVVLFFKEGGDASLVLLDLKMPGATDLATVVADLIERKIPIVILTAHADPNVVAEFITSWSVPQGWRPAEIVKKPFKPLDLVAVVGRHIRK